MAMIEQRRAGSVAVITLNRGKANAINADLLASLRDALTQVSGDPGAKAVVLGSASPAVFCAGFDVREVFGFTRPEMTAFFGRFAELFMSLRALPKPVVAAVAGPAYAGGAILALACDFRVLGTQASIAVNEVDLGVILPSPMIEILASTVPPGGARAMLLGAEAISAERALDWGLAKELAPADQVLDRALALAHRLGDKPARAFAAHKRALDPWRDKTLSPADLSEAMDAWFSEEARERRHALAARLTTGAARS